VRTGFPNGSTGQGAVARQLLKKAFADNPKAVAEARRRLDAGEVVTVDVASFQRLVNCAISRIGTQAILQRECLLRRDSIR
jgi:hypothetical protein